MGMLKVIAEYRLEDPGYATMPFRVVLYRRDYPTTTQTRYVVWNEELAPVQNTNGETIFVGTSNRQNGVYTDDKYRARDAFARRVGELLLGPDD